MVLSHGAEVPSEGCKDRQGLLSICAALSDIMSTSLSVQWLSSQSVGEGARAVPQGHAASVHPQQSNAKQAVARPLPLREPLASSSPPRLPFHR